MKGRTVQELRYNQDTNGGAPSAKYMAQSKRWYYDVAIGSVCVSGQDTGGSYSMFELSLGSGKGVARHTHTREEEAYYVLLFGHNPGCRKWFHEAVRRRR
jgi:hypothetical protein